MKRRAFIGLLAGVALAFPRAAAAQQARVYRVGFIVARSPVSDLMGADPVNPVVRAFIHALRALGYVEGNNLAMEWRSAEGQFERFPAIIAELLALKVDVIVTVANRMTLAAKEMTKTIPIVMAHSANPVGEGLIDSLSRPGGNVTGLTSNSGDWELLAKRVQLLKELLPRLSKVIFLQSEEEAVTDQELRAFEAAAAALGVQFDMVAHKPSDYVDAFAQITRERPDGLIVAASAANYANRQQIVEFAAKNNLPAIYGPRDAADIGGLIAYGDDDKERFRRAASFVDRILKGAKPADLPVEGPNKFVLAINVRTAKTLGLTIPPALLARADEVIE